MTENYGSAIISIESTVNAADSYFHRNGKHAIEISGEMSSTALVHCDVRLMDMDHNDYSTDGSTSGNSSNCVFFAMDPPPLGDESTHVDVDAIVSYNCSGDEKSLASLDEFRLGRSKKRRGNVIVDNITGTATSSQITCDDVETYGDHFDGNDNMGSKGNSNNSIVATTTTTAATMVELSSSSSIEMIMTNNEEVEDVDKVTISQQSADTNESYCNTYTGNTMELQ